MQYTLTRNNETATFTPGTEYTEIEITNTQLVDVRLIETINEWHGTWRYTGETEQREIKGKSWTEVPTAKARIRWAELKAQGWA